MVETESAIRIFERAWGWVKLIGAVGAVFAAVLVAAGIWQYIDLHSTVKSAETAVLNTKGSAEKSIQDTAVATRADIGRESQESLQQIRGAADLATKSSKNAIVTAKQQNAAIATQANTVRQDFQNQASAVTKDVASARQQIQAASRLQPEMTELQKQLAAAQAQIQEQQKVITSSEDFAKKIFSSRKQLVFDLKTLDKSQFATIDVGKNAEGVEIFMLFLIVPNTPVRETLQPQFNQTIAAPNSFFAIHNLVCIYIQKPARTELLGKPISISYFADTSDNDLVHGLTIREGRVYADDIRLPFGTPDTPTTTPAVPAPTITPTVPAKTNPK